MAETKYFRAVNEALAEELRRDESTFLMGEDIGQPEGIFAQTRGLQAEFGPKRVLDTPAGEVGFMGAAVGAALAGKRPIVEISFADFFPVCMDQLVNQAAKMRYMSGGQVALPMTVVSFGGGGLNAGPQHSSSYEAWLGSMPGLKLVTPATPRDAKGLIKSAVRDDDPVIVVLHKGLLQQREELPEDEEILVPLGDAAVLREGKDLTIACWSGAVRRVKKAAEKLEAQGIDVEIIDIRSVQPLDLPKIVESVKKTHRLLIAQETIGFCGVGAEIAAGVMKDAFDYLDSPIERVHPPFTPVPYSPPLENYHLPSPDQIATAAERLVNR